MKKPLLLLNYEYDIELKRQQIQIQKPTNITVSLLQSACIMTYYTQNRIHMIYYMTYYQSGGDVNGSVVNSEIIVDLLSWLIVLVLKDLYG